MKRLLTAAAALLCAFGFGATAQAQLTTITASHLKISGTDITAGKVLFTPVNTLGTPISFSQGGGGLNGPFAFSCNITTGALSGCTIPDAALANPANILYSIQVLDTSTGQPTSGKSYTLNGVSGITGSSWALDQYGPGLVAPTVNTLQSSYGTAAPPNPCNNGTIYVQNVAPAKEYVCINNVPVLVGVPITPVPQAASLTFEYLLNEGTGTVATDASGNAANGTITGATWEGTTDLSFVSGNYISVPQAASIATKTFMLALYMPPLTPLGDTSAYPSNFSPLCGSTTSMRCYIQASIVGPRSMRFYEYNISHTESSEFMTSGWHRVYLVCGSGGGSNRIFIDGAEVGNYITQGVNGCGTASTGNYQIGGSSALSNTFFFGKVAAAAGWSVALTASDVAKADVLFQDYLNKKGIYSTTIRPTVSSAPLILGGIDSRTSGVGISTSPNIWINAMTLTDGTYARTNLGVSGAFATDACAMFDGLYANHAGAGGGPIITVLWGGVNDYLLGSASSRQIANALKCLTQKAKHYGRVIVATEISSTGGDTGKNGLNPIIRAEALSWGADNIADLATDTHLGADGASTNATYFVSGVHPIDAGEVFVTAIMQDSVNELIGSTETSHHVTASTPYTEIAGDRWLDLTGGSAQTITLLSCLGKSLPRYLTNVGSASATVATTGSETLVGSTTVTVGSRAVFLPIPGALSTGGCSWRRVQ